MPPASCTPFTPPSSRRKRPKRACCAALRCGSAAAAPLITRAGSAALQFARFAPSTLARMAPTHSATSAQCAAEITVSSRSTSRAARSPSASTAAEAAPCTEVSPASAAGFAHSERRAFCANARGTRTLLTRRAAAGGAPKPRRSGTRAATTLRTPDASPATAGGAHAARSPLRSTFAASGRWLRAGSKFS